MKKIIFILSGTLLLIFILAYLGIRILKERFREADEIPNIIVLVQPQQTQTEAAEAIVITWLEHFKTRKYISAISDFRNIRIYKVAGSADSFAFTTSFSVKPKGAPERSEWKQNTNGHIEGEWIEEITARIIVVQDNGRYNFEALFYTIRCGTEC